MANGRQAYVICPMVEANDDIMGDMPVLENVIEYTEKLKKVLPETVCVEYLHGQMNPKAKNFIMEEFAAHRIDVLVSTTVIEVGINVPNATVMLVENAERFGLAQLHQLRGRVGRGKEQSYCIFISGTSQKDTMERLQVLNHSNDGFFISSEDMRLRGQEIYLASVKVVSLNFGLVIFIKMPKSFRKRKVVLLRCMRIIFIRKSRRKNIENFGSTTRQMLPPMLSLLIFDTNLKFLITVRKIYGQVVF